MLIVDSGNFSDNPTASGRIKTRALVEAMGRLGYAAVNVGDRELTLGYDAFMQNAADARFPLLSANIVRQDTGEPVFEPYAIHEAPSPDGKTKLKIGLLGVTRYNPLFLKAGPGDSSLVIAKPDVELQKYVGKLRAEVDVLVLLAALHREEASRIAAAVPGIDFIVGAYGGIITARETKAGDTWLLYAGNQGKRIGETRVYRNGAGPIESVVTHLHLLTKIYPHNQAVLDWVNTVSAEAKGAQQAAATGGTP